MSTPFQPIGTRRRLLQLGMGLLLSGASLAGAPGASWAEAKAGKEPASSPVSSKEQIALADHLKRQGVLFYGAWWCSHCQHQKALFGSPAQDRLPYVECDKDDSGRQRCNAAQVRAYPSWDYKGERREGVLTLEELKLWSAFPSKTTGSR